MRLMPSVLLLFVLGLTSARADQGEATTNGGGGGPWSEPATWRGKAIPKPEEDVVIRKGDTVVFDRNDDGMVTCQKLLIDPGGMLTFKTGAGKIVCSVAGGIESYGPIKLDGTRAADDVLELRLIGDASTKRIVKLFKGAGLLLVGRANLPEGRRNVFLTAPAHSDPKKDPAALIDGTSVQLEAVRAELSNVVLQVGGIDNTGTRPNERLNLIENRFIGVGRVFCQDCDTPVITRNLVDRGSLPPVNTLGITLHACPLAEVRQNTVRGYTTGIHVDRSADVTVSENIIEKCSSGITITNGNNQVIRQNQITGCDRGIALLSSGMTGVEDNVVDGANEALHFQFGSAQVGSLQVRNLKPKGNAIVYNTSGQLTLLNSEILPEQVKVLTPDKNPVRFRVQAWQYLVVAVPGAPPNSEVVARTVDSKLDADVADPNVRNAPAPISNGSTPLPHTAGAMMLKSWAIDPLNKTIEAPEYEVKALAPAAKEGETRKVLHTWTTRPTPAWFRAKLDDPKPTLEVSRK